MSKRRKASPASRISAAFSSLRSGRQQSVPKVKSVDDSKSIGLSSSLSASRLTDKPNEYAQKPLSARLSANLDEHMEDDSTRAERINRTPSPRRPMSASSLFTINESASSRIQLDEESETRVEDEDTHPEMMPLNGAGSLSSSNQTRRRSGGSIDSSCSSLVSHALVGCFCLHRTIFRGGTH